MQYELAKFTRNNEWDQVPEPNHLNFIGTKWIFKNKFDEKDNLTWNKDWLDT